MKNRINIFLFLIYAGIMVINACKKDDDKDDNNNNSQLPAVSTSVITNITDSSATGGGQVTSEGASTVTARGICWGTATNPTINDNKTTDGSGTGSFISTLAGLNPHTVYYVRAYATNSAGTAYGSSVSFTTSLNIITGTITDIQGNQYKTVTIGTQTWMAENLRTTQFRNGDNIVTTSPPTLNITSESTPIYQWVYNGNDSNLTAYGRLYTWYAATDGRGLCPTGWHLPTDDEWTVLQTYMIANGFNFDGSTDLNKIAKALSVDSLWFTSASIGAIGFEMNTNNSSKFSAPPGGFRYDDGAFYYKGSEGHFWSATDFGTQYPKARQLFYDFSNLINESKYKKYGLSVRCVAD